LTRRLETGAPVTLAFSHAGFEFRLASRIVHFRQNEIWVFGVQFDPARLGREERRSLRDFAAALEAQGVPTLRPRPDLAAELREWWGTRFKRARV
jgi:hypothetical protein